MGALHAVRRCRGLEGGERRLLARAWVALGIVDIALRVAGFRRVAERAHPPARCTFSGTDLRRAHRYARWLEAASRHHLVRVRCLQRSLVLNYWLRREGLPSELRIGVRKDGDALRAHAWVELGRHVVNDPVAAVAAFTPLAGSGGQRPPGSREPIATLAVQAAGAGTERATWP